MPNKKYLCYSLLLKILQAITFENFSEISCVCVCVCEVYNPVVVQKGQASLIPCGHGTKDSCTKTHLNGRASQSKQRRVRFAINS